VSYNIVRKMNELELEGYMGKVKAKVKKEFKIFDLASLDIKEGKEGDIIELPLWAAEILEEKFFIEYEEEDFFLEVQKALSREKLQPKSQITELRKDFYVKAKFYILKLRRENKKDEAEKVLSSLFDLFSLRLVKLLHLASSLALPFNIEEKLTREEREFMYKAKDLIKSWRKEILGVGE